MSYGVFPDAASTDQSRVRGETRKDSNIELDWFYVPNGYFPTKETQAPRTYDFIISTDLQGPLFTNHFFQEEMQNLLLLQWLCSLIWGIGLPGYLMIGIFFSVYNLWSVQYAFYQVFWVSEYSPYKPYFTFWNFLLNPLRRWLVNDILFLIGLLFSLMPVLNTIICTLTQALMYINMILY